MMEGEPKKGDRHFRAFYVFLPKRHARGPLETSASGGNGG
jgi:hypothetical protein